MPENKYLAGKVAIGMFSLNPPHPSNSHKPIKKKQ